MSEKYHYVEFPESVGTTLAIYDGKGKYINILPCLSAEELKAAKVSLNKGVLPE